MNIEEIKSKQDIIYENISAMVKLIQDMEADEK